ncbi:hypothetical protein JOQ06_015993 [Pogonophryne albipinna]|uniref:Cathepsin S, ortholog 1 n=1 Tax=Pogonophryne albipinna TaxID=1090488 RepID=A0AAD6FAY1_9TELE|nr:hypothetical protein JOQ06_015993 [Pogonophryne albipinna]
MHILCAVLLLPFVILTHSSSALNKVWEEWQIERRKVYDNKTEMEFRRAVWEKNMMLVLRHNQEASAGNHSFTMGLNHLSDIEPRGSATPQSVDWRKHGLVSPVQNQGMCGSCWAFSSLGALEGQMKRRTGVLVPLSPQNLVDCSTSDGNHGCRGGYISKSFSYVIRNRGVDSEKFYPYKHQNGKCLYSVRGKAGYCSDFHILPGGDEGALQAAVASEGPVAVVLNAMLKSFHLYRGGLYNCWSWVTAQTQDKTLAREEQLGHRVGRRRLHSNCKKQEQPLWYCQFCSLPHAVIY